jgi:hypothetical protein
MIRRILNYIKSWFVTEKPQKPKVRRKRKEKSHHGAHYYLGDLLDRMEQAFGDMRILRKANPDAHAIASRLGVNVVSSDYGFYDALEPYFLETMPSQVCAYIGDKKERDDEFVPCRFVVMLKHSRPVNVQMCSGLTIYEVAMTYQFEGHAVAGSFHVGISKDGEVTPLRECKPTHFKGGIVRMQWAQSQHLIDLAQDNDSTVEELAREIVALAANAQLASERGLSVRVSKGKERLAFSIDTLRTPYFFQDREKVVNENGKTKPILHIVKAHKRKDGKVIKTHWRGLRQFSWNGYDVKIGMGGKHLLNYSGFNLAAADPMTNDKTFSAKEVAEDLLRVEDLA